MKNISRRVFIKGMAVAAVATAASTVLTGCKLPTGEETVTEPVETSSYTFVDPLNDKNTLTVSAQKMVVGEAALGTDKSAVATVRVSNDMGKDIIFTNAEVAYDSSLTPTGIAVGNYYVLVTAYADGNELNIITPAFGTNTNVKVGNGVINDLSLNLDLSAKTAAKESVTVKFALKKVVAGSNASDLSLSTIKTTEFTFKL